MSKKTIFCDIDNCIFPLLETTLPKYNNTYNDNLQFEQITSYDINKFIKTECKSFFKEFATEDVWLTAKPYEGATEVLTQLNKRHNIFFASSGHPNTMKFRDNWLDKYFSFYSSAQLIMIRKKQLLMGDILFDDYSDNLIGGTYKSIVFNQKWNESYKFENRMFKWDEASIDMIDEIVNNNECPHKEDWKYCLNCKNGYADDGATYCKSEKNGYFKNS